MGHVVKILGLDLSLTGTGVARLDVSGGSLRTTTISTGTRRGHDRLNLIIGTLRTLIPGMDVAVIEGPSYGSKSQSQRGHHERAGLWWVVAHSLWVNQIEYVVLPPSNRAMYGTGNGQAKKEQVLRDTRDRWGNLCHFANDNEADAALLALALADHMGHPIGTVPPTHSRALASLDFTAAPSYRKKAA